MTDLSQLSDAQLTTLYQQQSAPPLPSPPDSGGLFLHVPLRNGTIPDTNAPTSNVAGLSDDQLMAAYQQQKTAQQNAPDPVSVPSVPKTMLDQGTQGATFGFGDEVTDRLGASIAALTQDPQGFLKGEVSDPALAEQIASAPQQTKQALSSEWQNHPVISLGSQLAGGLLTGGAANEAASGTAIGSLLSGSQAAQGAGFGGKAANILLNMAKGGSVGSASGALYGAGTADPGQRLQGAGQSAVLGGLVGAAIPGVAAGISGLAGAASDLLKPLSNSGRQQIIGQTLQNLATDPQSLNNLSNVQQFVPGSLPTTAQATGDYGLLAAQKGLQNESPQLFAERGAANNSARNTLLNQISGSPQDLQSAIDNRNLATGILRNFAFANKSPVDPIEPLNVIDSTLASPTGKRDAVNSALNWAQSKLAGETDPENLYAARQDLNDAMQGKFNADKPALALAKSQLYDVKQALDQSIERGAPGYGNYLQKYREMSKPINQMEIMQGKNAQPGIQSQILSNAAPDPNTGEYSLLQPRLTAILKNRGQQLADALSPEQNSGLQDLQSDLQRSTPNAAIKPAGSDTMQNFTSSNLMARMLGPSAASSPLARTVARPLEWAYKIPEEKLHQMMIDAMLNPDVAQSAVNAAQPSAPFVAMQRQKLLASMLTGTAPNMLVNH